jgi:hypothetical protein
MASGKSDSPPSVSLASALNAGPLLPAPGLGIRHRECPKRSYQNSIGARGFAAGEDRTCKNWTSSAQGAAMLGHADRKGLRDDAASKSWNSSHPSRGPEGGCSQNDLRGTGGAGLFYCFAAN